METSNVKIKFNTAIVEIEINKMYEEKVKEEFTRFCRIKKPFGFKSFVDSFINSLLFNVNEVERSNKKEEINLKILRIVSIKAA